MSQKLTDKLVKGLVAPERGNRITYDDAVKGFGVRITAGGAVAFVLNYRVRSTGTERRYTIGNPPEWSVAAARDKAKDLKREVDSGGDPLNELEAIRGAPTVADLCARFEEEHLDKLRPRTQTDYRAIIRNEVVPALGELKVAAVGFEHVEQLHRKIKRRAPILANRALAVLSKMFALAIKWRWRTDNPCKGVERNREIPRNRYLSDDELTRLNTALDEHDDLRAADVFRLLLWTGARRGEVLSAQWNQFDLEKGIWTKPAAATKQKTAHRIPLNKPALQLLARLPHDGDWLFPGRSGHHRINIDRSWGLICKAAKITGLHVHDLRHSYASQLASEGVGLHVIGGLLGHTQPRTTHRYAHLFDRALLEATERAGARLAPKTKGRGGKVMKFPVRAGK
jgi:integrase